MKPIIPLNQQLMNIRRNDHNGESSDQRKAAKEVETIFLNEFLKIMMEQTSFNKDKTVSTFIPIITAEIAQSLAERGIGIGDHLMNNPTMVRPSVENQPEAGHNESSDINYMYNNKISAQNESAASIWNSEKLRLPVKGLITSGFGLRHDPFDGKLRHHNGMDIAVPEGTPISAAAPGTVVFSGYSNSYGNCIIVKHDDGLSSLYAHNAVNYVKNGEVVDSKSIIALSGATGKATGPHVHFEIRKYGIPVNPLREIG